MTPSVLASLLSLSDHLRPHVLAGPPIPVVVHVGAPIDTRGRLSGNELARVAIARPIEELGELAA